MQEALVNLLHDYIRKNNPDLLISLQQENKVIQYLKDSVSAADGLINQLSAAHKPASMIEELCMEEITMPLRPSRFNYLKALLEEEFPSEYMKLDQNGLLVTELINMITLCNSLFEEFGFSEKTEDNYHLRYMIMGSVYEHVISEK